MECPPIRAQAWLDEHERDLAGTDTDAAIRLIETAGLHARVMPPEGGWMTQELRNDRITLWLTDAGTVGAVDAG